jgi:hypothetical protein
MGQGADGMSAGGEDVGKVSTEIDHLRSELGGIVAELDRRRHDAFDLGLQARRHPVAVAVVAAAAALLVGGLLAVATRRRRRSRRPTVRARKARRALWRLMDHPDRVAAEPSIANKVATAVASLVATSLAKRLLERNVPRPREAPSASAVRP